MTVPAPAAEPDRFEPNGVWQQINMRMRRLVGTVEEIEPREDEEPVSLKELGL